MKRALGFVLLLLASPVSADAIDDTIVHISCTSPDGPAIPASGVLISDNGMVLTVRHALPGQGASLPDNTVCTGAIGNANRPRSTLIPQAFSLRYDAMLMKFPQQGTPFKRFCRLEPHMQRSQIISTGFPLNSTTGVPSSRVGVLSTVQPDLMGIIETDSGTTMGMSGGMVTLAENGSLVGIVSGAVTDLRGIPSIYRVLVAEVLEAEFASFGLTIDAEGCQSRERLTPVAGPLQGGTWRASDPPLPLGIRDGEGFCFLVSLWGSMDHPSDRVEIAVQNGEFVLYGHNSGGGSHGGYAQCARF